MSDRAMRPTYARAKISLPGSAAHRIDRLPRKKCCDTRGQTLINRQGTSPPTKSLDASQCNW